MMSYDVTVRDFHQEFPIVSNFIPSDRSLKKNNTGYEIGLMSRGILQRVFPCSKKIRVFE